MDQAELIVNLYKVEKLTAFEIQEQLNVSKEEIKQAIEKFGYSTKIYITLITIILKILTPLIKHIGQVSFTLMDVFVITNLVLS